MMDVKLEKVWSANFEFGIPEIDDQHRALFDLAATFRGHGDEIRMMKSLVFLCNYATGHLRDEEALLQKIAFPQLAPHKEAHRQFRARLQQLLQGARQMSLDDIASEVEDLINGWFLNHILTMDAQYVPLVRAHSQRKKEDSARQQHDLARWMIS